VERSRTVFDEEGRDGLLSGGPFLYMKQAFSKINTFLIFFNIFLMLSIAYLWYPTYKEEKDISVFYVATKVEHINTKLEITDNVVEQSTSSTTSTIDVPLDSVSTPIVLSPTINLSVPFTSQAPEANWDQPWQDACEEAAILMLDAYYKGYTLSPLFAKDELLKMVAWEEQKSWGYSIPLVDVQKVSEWYMGNSFSFHIQKEPSIEGIKQTLAAGNPVLVVAYGKLLENPNFREGGPEYHALIIRGYNQDGFITNDPGTRNGKEFFYTYDNLMSSIHDWNGGDVEHGDAVVLVVERL